MAPTRNRQRRPAPGSTRSAVRPATAFVLCIGLVLTAALSWLARDVGRHNEQRLLKLKVAETGSVLQALVPGVETPLRSAAEITNAANGDPSEFVNYMRPFVGTGKTFTAAAMWRISPGAPTIVTEIGRPLLLARDPARVPGLFRRAVPAAGITVTSFLGGTDPRLGYALTTAVPTTRLAVYAEAALPPNRMVRLPAGGPFSDLKFKLFLGRRADDANLLYGNATRLGARQARITVPFGDTSLTLVASPARPLAGALASALWWIAALVGLFMTVSGAVAAERLLRGRERARALAAQLDASLAEQRRIAGELQHALLPHELPVIDDLGITARYVAGAVGVELGGDWYDVVALDDGSAFFTVGDVSGRGVGAGAVMARLQYAARALASDDPASVLGSLAKLVDLHADGRFATVLCGHLDLRTGRLVLANAGHLPPVLVGRDGDDPVAELLEVPPGPPIGISAAAAPYAATTFQLPRRGALLAFTDGLVERRDEELDAGLERLRRVAAGGHGEAERVLDAAFADRASIDDDAAAIVFEWAGDPVATPERESLPATGAESSFSDVGVAARGETH